MGLRKIIKMFETGCVSVSGMMGTGKDLLMGNVIMRRKRPYVSNMNYGGDWHPLDWSALDCGCNTYKNFISGDLNYYEHPFPDGWDIYGSDMGFTFPAHYNDQLNKQYPYLPTLFGLVRQLGDCRFHVNSQALNRVWDKFREQSDLYITCKWVFKPFVKWFGLVIQHVYVYESYDSAVRRVPPFRVRKPLFSPTRRFQWELAFQNYEISHGKIKSYILIYRNLSKHNTRQFKEMFLAGNKRSPDELASPIKNLKSSGGSPYEKKQK